MFDYLFIIAAFSYVLIQFVEIISFGSRVAGKLTDRLAMGVTLQHSISIISRLFLPPLLLSMSLMIESDIDIRSFFIISIVLTMSAFLVSIIILFKFNYFQLLFQHLFVLYQDNKLPASIGRLLVGKKVEFAPISLDLGLKLKDLSFKKIAASGVAYFFLSTGFLIAFSLAIMIPDYRMTISQFSAIFHGVGAIILSMYIDPMISRSLDIKLENRHWLQNIYAIFVGRVLSYFFAALFFFILYLLYL